MAAQCLAYSPWEALENSKILMARRKPENGQQIIGSPETAYHNRLNKIDMLQIHFAQESDCIANDPIPAN